MVLTRLDFRPCRNNLTLADPLALRSHRQGVLELPREDNVFDEHTFNGHTPAFSDITNDFADALGDLLSTLNHILQHTRTDDMAKRSLGALNESLANVGDSKGSLVGGNDVVIDDGGEMNRNIVLIARNHQHFYPHALSGLKLHVPSSCKPAAGPRIAES